MEYGNICMGCMSDKGDVQICPNCGYSEGTPPESPHVLPPRTILNNKYIVGRVLGCGGFGITYLGWDINLNLKLAIKEFFPQGFVSRTGNETQVSVYTGDATQQFEYGLNKFLQEARTLAKFDSHPNIVSVKDFFRANGTAYIVMNYLEGIDLKQYLNQKGGKLGYQDAINLIMPVIDALKEVHNEGILHRDISPDNVFITAKGQIKLLDFGAARQSLGTGKSLSVILKPGYAPEEQYRTRGNQGPWTDVYAVAATFYRLICGQVPLESLERMVEDSIIPPSQLGSDIPPEAERALLKALAVKAENRFQDMSTFQNALLGNIPVDDYQVNSVPNSIPHSIPDNSNQDRYSQQGIPSQQGFQQQQGPGMYTQQGMSQQQTPYSQQGPYSQQQGIPQQNQGYSSSNMSSQNYQQGYPGQNIPPQGQYSQQPPIPPKKGSGLKVVLIALGSIIGLFVIILMIGVLAGGDDSNDSIVDNNQSGIVENNNQVVDNKDNTDTNNTTDNTDSNDNNNNNDSSSNNENSTDNTNNNDNATPPNTGNEENNNQDDPVPIQAPTIVEPMMTSNIDDGGKPVDTVNEYDLFVETMYASCIIQDAPANTTVYFVWRNTDENFELGSFPVTVEGSRYLYSYYSPRDEYFPIGNYQVAVYINDNAEPASVIPFTVSNNNASNNAGDSTAENIELTDEEMVALDTFFSNFAEIYMPEFTVESLSDDHLIYFGVVHNYINNYDSRFQVNGEYAYLDAGYVDESCYKYFALYPGEHHSIEDIVYENGKYKMPVVDIPSYDFAQIDLNTVYDAGEGIYYADVITYTAANDFSGDVHGCYDTWKENGEQVESAGTYSAIYQLIEENGKQRYVIWEYVEK